MKRKRLRLRRVIVTLVISLVLTYTIAGNTQIVEVQAKENLSSAGKVVNANGTSIEENGIQQIKTFVNEVEKTKGFVVYANVLDRTNHIEGNISVNDISAGNVNIVLQNVSEKSSTDYSYIGNSNAGI